MKIALGVGLVIIIAIVILIISKNKSPNSIQSSQNTQSNLFSLNDGNQDELIFKVELSQTWLDSLNNKYTWDKFNEYDNKMWEYMYNIFDKTVEESNAKTNEELWSKFNRHQKLFWTFLAFNGDTDNGGVYQFIFNRPQFIFAVEEMFKELGLNQLHKDYTKILEELAGKQGKILELKSQFNDQSKTWNKRWDSFAQGYKELKSTETIENYYYSNESRVIVHQKVADYIEKNLSKFAVVK